MILKVLAGAAVIALLFAGWLTFNSEQNNAPAQATARLAAGASSGYSARDAELIETGADGRPMYTLHASTIRQQPGTQTAVLDDVAFQFRDAAGEVWNGHADQGYVQGAASTVDLTGAVSFWGTLPQSAAPVRISSDRLDVDTRTEVVTTPDPVVLEWNGQSLDARGLVAHLKEQWVKLQSDVHGTYHP